LKKVQFPASLFSSPPAFSVPRQPFSSPPAFQFPASLPSDRLWLRVSYSPRWQVISPPPPLGDQEGCSMEGSQPQPAAWPRHHTPQLTWGQERGKVSGSSTNTSTSTPACQPGQPAAYPSSCHHTAPDVQYMCSEGHSSKAGLQDSGWQGGDQSVLQHCSSYNSSSS
jgi:hypothetical protein